MEHFHLADFRGGCRHAEGFVFRKGNSGKDTRIFVENVFAVRYHPLHVVEQCVAGRFPIPINDGIAVEHEIVIGSEAPQLDVVATRFAPIAQKLVFVCIYRFAFIVGTGGKFREREFHTLKWFAGPAAVFPECHTRVLDIRIDLVAFREFLQDDAVKLSHARKPENKDRKSAFVVEFYTAVFPFAGLVQVGEGEISDFSSIFFSVFVEYPG